ncbi:MAG: hypothetical protein ACP5G0_04430 [Desulfomonilia bacterium]
MIKQKRILILFASPLIAILLCVSSSLVLTDDRNVTLEQPEFLSYVDQLSLFTVEKEHSPELVHIRDVFIKSAPEPRNISVNLIVESNSGTYCIINGEKLRVGQSGDGFELSSIDRHSVTLTFPDGSKETINVKVY